MSTRTVSVLAAGTIALILVATRLRLATAVGVVDADESVIFLMAHRIAALHDLPVFHYGNAYLGSLDAFLAALAMRIGGDGPVAARLVPILLSILFAATTCALARAVSGRRAGLIAAAYVAAGPTLLVVWGAKLHLGYLDIVVLGDLLALVAWKLTDGAHRPRRSRTLLVGSAGLICGLGLWCHVLFVVFIAAALVFFCAEQCVRSREARPALGLRAAGAWTAAFVIGASPLIAYNLAHGGATLATFSRGLGPGGPITGRFASALYNLVAACGPVVLGVELPWRMHRPELPVLLPAGVASGVFWLTVSVLTLSVAVGVRAYRRLRPALSRQRRAWAPILLGLVVAVSAGLGCWRLFHGDWPATPDPLDPRLPVATPALVRLELLDPGKLVYGLWLVPALALFWPWRGDEAAPAAVDGGTGSVDGAIGRASVRPRARRLLASFAIVPLLFYAASSYGAFRSPRFLFPLYVALPVILAAGAVQLGRWGRGLGALVTVALLGVNLAPQLAAAPALALQPVHYAGRLEVPSSYAGLVGCLDTLGVQRVYSGYWTGFPLLFASGERILPSDGGPGRLPEVSAAVERSRQVAFVFYRDKLDDEQFLRVLHVAGVAYKATDCGPFAIYSGLDIETLRRPDRWRAVRAILSHP